MCLYAFHLGQIISTILEQVDYDSQDGNAVRTQIRKKHPKHKTQKHQKHRFRYGAICRIIKALAILRCLYGSETVLLGWLLGSVRLRPLIFLKKMVMAYS